jgi:hypothetical protein
VTSENELESHLGAVNDELVALIGGAKQAVWTATSNERRLRFDGVKTSLAATEASRALERLVGVLAQDLRSAIDDVRRRAGVLDGEWRQLLLGLANDLEQRVDGL